MLALTPRCTPPPVAGPEALEAVLRKVAAGRPVAVDDGASGALCVAADLITADTVNFLATEARGLVELALTAERCDELSLPLMCTDAGSRRRPSYTVSVEARHGVTTGISAADRARTIAVAVAPTTTPRDLVSPGHVLPLRTHPRGVLLEAGHPEAGVDLARLAGRAPAAVVCTVLDDDGDVADPAYLRRFAARHGIAVVEIAAVVRHRLRSETVLQRRMDTTLATRHGTFRVIGYVSPFDARAHIAFVKGDLPAQGAVPVEVHEQRSLDALLHGSAGDDPRLRAALSRIEAAGRGVVICLGPRADGDGPTADEACYDEILRDLEIHPARAGLRP
jgi:3,4-dihydroxy 2-butanone 4-phosphate synthase/GTP cyclohydrolase II